MREKINIRKQGDKFVNETGGFECFADRGTTHSHHFSDIFLLEFINFNNENGSCSSQNG
ncbi:TPA: hypothetical protein I7142_16805 [Vibrio vulnificus]|uniref:hypothetical protein n=1 Tax=Vibrio vulnificus TaxID=672 RepID=UPI00186571E7|nr:hypothetical protein [Vibrio vulnificus]EGR7942992.1 hypothetical protein [Vibrio vulnificus]ELH4810977.1 hypothetical protein [Vibrio vulnificus]ELV8667286.1 hypothetical protein [Vibrio vulnificus]ELV8804586.1 hypothetical protein [Vibrio vulnificus]MCU8409766.1 hypothetical protein [Vibrio vulnificus]